MNNSPVIEFTKMHGLGNDFIVINTLQQPMDISKLPIRQLADRRLGIGCDQLLIIEASTQADFFCRIFNADGSEAKQCGNGIRCVARYLHEGKWYHHDSFRIATHAGIFPIHIENYDRIHVAMGAPTLEEKSIQLTMNQQTTLGPLTVLSLGNAHAILKVTSLSAAAVLFEKFAADISMHTHFKEQVNVGFMEVINRHHLRLRTFERGSGETHACGSNACAATVAGIINGWLDHEVQVEFHFGSLFIRWLGEGKPIEMSGPATRVFAGQWLVI